MEETKWLTKGKIITFIVIIILIVGIFIGIKIHRSNLKKAYINYEGQLEYAASNYLLKEKIKLYEYEWREISDKDILKQKLVINKRASDCNGYVIATALKDDTLDLEESTSNVPENENSDSMSNTDQSVNDESANTDNNTASDTEKKRVSSNIKYKAYVTCKKIYTTEGYGEKPDSKNKNTEKTQTQDDTEKPVIELFGDATIKISVGDEYVEAGAVATDNVDGDITKKIKITGKVDTKKAGEYIIKYTVSDKAGNKTSVERKVIVEEKVEEPKDDTKVETPSDNNTTNNTTDNSTNNNTNNGNSNNNYYRDTIAPIITLNYSYTPRVCLGSKMDISVNGPYGYSAWDNVDGNITSKVSVTGDTGVINSAGTYNLYYTVSDSSGNRASVTKQFKVESCGNPIKKPDSVIPVTVLVVTPTSKTMVVSQTLQLSVSVGPDNATNKSVTYSSSNSNVASVTSGGLVTAKSKGTATIKVTTSSGLSRVCRITVS